MFLRAVEPDSIEDREALVQMRIVCGWNSQRVPIWLENIRAGKLLIWFICEPSSDAISDGVNPPSKYDLLGMIGLILEKLDTTISLSQHRRASISSLFIYQEYRRKSFARQAWLLVEEEARKIGAESIEINTAITSGMAPWYERMGYKRFKVIDNYYLEELIEEGLINPSLERATAMFLEKYL
ncbi:hypothetical protein CPB86DRAFT_777870 [Serendipita vermifera]|nr:hypothetical protein CPB86DRAFT_777870 [Serendipita vermifera]